MFEFMTCTPPPIHQPPPSFVKRRMPAPYLHTPFPHCYQEYPVIWFTILVPNYSNHTPLLPPREKNTLPSFLLKEKTIPLYLPPLLCAAAVMMVAKDTYIHPQIQGEREAYPAPFMKTSSCTPTNVYPTAMWQYVPHYLEHEESCSSSISSVINRPSQQQVILYTLTIDRES